MLFGSAFPRTQLSILYPINLRVLLDVAGDWVDSQSRGWPRWNPSKRRVPHQGTVLQHGHRENLHCHEKQAGTSVLHQRAEPW